MGNKPAKIEKEEILVRIAPPIDPALARWLARDIERIQGFTVKNPPSIKPPDHYIEYMRLNGWLDLDLDDPDLAHLFKPRKILNLKTDCRLGIMEVHVRAIPISGIQCKDNIFGATKATVYSCFEF